MRSLTTQLAAKACLAQTSHHHISTQTHTIQSKRATLITAAPSSTMQQIIPIRSTSTSTSRAPAV
jgi:hypothetical protein